MKNTYIYIFTIQNPFQSFNGKVLICLLSLSMQKSVGDLGYENNYHIICVILILECFSLLAQFNHRRALCDEK